MRYILFITIALMIAVSAHAMTPIGYDWEDDGTVLAVSPDPELPSLIVTNVAADGDNQVHSGTYSLRLEQNDPSGTSVAYLAYLWNLQEGDYIYAEFWRYDDSPGSLPLVRIAAHWNDQLPEVPDHFDGIAGGNEDYGAGEGWDSTHWDWTVAGGHSGMVIEAVVNGEVGDVVWLDGLYIEVSGDPTEAYIQIPGDNPVGIQARSWSGVKSLFR